MAVSTCLSLRFIPNPERTNLHHLRSPPISTIQQPSPTHRLHHSLNLKKSRRIQAIEETQDEKLETETVKPEENSSELGSEIKEAMKEMRKEKEQGKDNLWSGVAEEIREIEWPPFGKVVGTTGVVLGVIAGSSVVLLTVNAILAELSDGLFAGKGVQDFFG